jgi:hypothetical protein
VLRDVEGLPASEDTALDRLRTIAHERGLFRVGAASWKRHSPILATLRSTPRCASPVRDLLKISL